jgi:hypothetical protein
LFEQTKATARASPYSSKSAVSRFTMIVSLEAIFLSRFVLISQNRQGREGSRTL